MEVILRLLSELRLVLVAIAGICAAAFVFTGLSSLRDMRRAVFRLERSAITSRVIGSWLKAGLCVIVGLAIWSIPNASPQPVASANDNPLSATPTVTVADTLSTPVPTADLSQAQAVMTLAPLSATLVTEAAPLTDTTVVTASQPVVIEAVALVVTATATTLVIPTVAPLSSATPAPAATQVVLPTLPPATGAAQAAQSAQSVPTLAPAPTDAPAAAGPEPSLAANCPNPDAQIFSPTPGETVSGGYVIRGTAGFNQGKFKIEILRPNIEAWAFLWEGFNQVKGGVLMPNFNSGLFPPGIYTIRLMLIDGGGQETGITCTVPIRIS